jgi:Ca2+-binding RTX toxin-like protein
MATITGTPGDDNLFGTPDDDDFHGNGGNDAMSGLAGNDIYYVEDSGDDVFENGGEGADTVYAFASYVLNEGSFVEFLTADPAAGSAAINLTGNHQDNTVTGNAGANVLHGGGGTDVLVGLAGDDIYYSDVAATQVTEAAGGGNDALYVSLSYVLAEGTEVETLSANDHSATTAINLTGNHYSNTLVGNAGANILHGGGGVGDVLIGRAGDDVYYTDVATPRVEEAVGEGTDALYTSVSYVLAFGTSVERLSANDLAATIAINLTGNNMNNTVIGNAGANILHGGGGTDVLIGLAGNDTYYTDVAATQVVERVGEGTDALYTSVSYALVNESIELLSANSHGATSAIDLTGNYLDQTIIGNDGANIIQGGGGTDILNGMGGNDIFYVDVAATQVQETDDRPGSDVVYVSVSYVLAFGASVEILSTNDHASTAAINLTGNNMNNRMIGNAGDNILDGGTSQDILVGLGGSDTLLGGGGNDQLFGGDGDDILSAGTGNDRLDGNLGNDTYYIESGTDIVTEFASEGTDTLYTEISYNLANGNEVEIIAITNAASTLTQSLGGNDIGNELRGSEGINALNGRGGDDVLSSYGGNDFLDGGEGLDALNGGAGADTFRFSTALGATNVDTIADFEVGIDKIGLNASIFGVTQAELAAGAFRTGPAATDADDRIIYDSTTGALYFDSDGVGGAAQIQFATLTGAPPITANDFIV